VINYDGRRFRALDISDGSAVAQYHQNGDLLWGEFAGGSVRRGSLCGLCRPGGELEFAYTTVLMTGEVIAGHCRSTPQVLADGRIRLSETWQRFGVNAAAGVSEIEEV
jgi:hypothetical protein